MQWGRRAGLAYSRRRAGRNDGSPHARRLLPRGTSARRWDLRCLVLLSGSPVPRKGRGRRHPLAGLLAAGVAAVVAGSRSFAATGQRAADVGPEALAVPGAARRRSSPSDARSPWSAATRWLRDGVPVEVVSASMAI